MWQSADVQPEHRVQGLSISWWPKRALCSWVQARCCDHVTISWLGLSISWCSIRAPCHGYRWGRQVAEITWQSADVSLELHEQGYRWGRQVAEITWQSAAVSLELQVHLHGWGRQVAGSVSIPVDRHRLPEAHSSKHKMSSLFVKIF